MLCMKLMTSLKPVVYAADDVTCTQLMTARTPGVYAADDVTLAWRRACVLSGWQLLPRGQCGWTCLLLVWAVAAGSACDLLYLEFFFFNYGSDSNLRMNGLQHSGKRRYRVSL